jgi:rRNA maturation protein Nop10
VILLALYAIAVWVGVAWWRRRWSGAILLVGSALPIIASTLLAGYVASEPGAAERYGFAGTVAGYGRVIYTVSAFYTALTLGIGLLIFVQPRRLLSHQCGSCGYDMRGTVTGICPECGTDHAAPGPPHPSASDCP